MSLARVRESFPEEVTPTHYELRRGEPWFHDYDEGVRTAHGPVEPDVLGRFDNLYDARLARGRAIAETAPWRQAYPPAIPDDLADMADLLGREAGRPYLVAVYPDGSYAEPGSPSSVSAAHVIDHAGTAATDASRAAGSRHRRLIDALQRASEFHPVGMHPDVAALRRQALRDHDPAALLAAADLMDEAGYQNGGRVNPRMTTEIRDRLRLRRYARAYARAAR